MPTSRCSASDVRLVVVTPEGKDPVDEHIDGGAPGGAATTNRQSRSRLDAKGAREEATSRERYLSFGRSLRDRL